MIFLSLHRQQNEIDAQTREQLIAENRRLRTEVNRLKAALEDTGQPASHRDDQADRSRFESVIENTPMVGVQGFDCDGVVRHWNEASKQLYGYDTAEAIGKRMQDLIIAPGDTGAFEAALEEIIDKKVASPNRIWKVRTKSGGEKWVYSSLFPVVEHGKIAEIFCMDVDITDRKAMETTLRENEEQLRTLINAMPDIVCFKDGEGRWLAANEFDLQLFEIGNVAYRGKKDSELAGYSDFYRDAFLACEESDEAAWRQGKTSRADEIIPKPDGSQLTFDVIKVPLYNPDGSRKGLVVIGRDITESRRAQAELKRSYERMEIMVSERTAELSRARNTLKTILDTVPVGVIMAEADTGRITYLSPSAIKILGYEGSAGPEGLGLQSYQLLKPDGTPLPQEERPLMRSLKDGVQVYNVEAIVRRRDGTEVTVLVSSAPIRDAFDRIQAAVANLVDVTGLKRAEGALKENEQFLKNVFDGIQDGISVLDKDLNILRVNHTMEKLYPAMVPLAGKKCYEAYHNRTAPCEKCPTLLAMRTKSLQSEIVPIVHADRSPGWLELYAFPLIDASGNVTGVVEHVRDVTGRKIAEEQLREAKAQAELYLDLMGHDINNMHQIAMGYLEIARDMMPHDDRRREYVDKPIEVLQRSTELIRNVRKLQKLKEGIFQTRAVDVCKMLTEIQSEFGAVPHKAITLNLRGCERCHVRANELLHDVFANLVNNAIKHTGDKADIVIDLYAVTDNDGRHCRVDVGDNGPGISDDFKPRIFNRMLKGSDKAKGGLGLYLVKSLVDSFGGSVWVEDRVPGDHTQGARFVVMLPATES